MSTGILRKNLLCPAFLFLTLVVQAGIAQLPAGTTGITAVPQGDSLRVRAAEAVDKQDFPTAQKLLTQLTAQAPDAILLYDLGFTDEALNDEPAAASAYQRAIAANPKYFEPRLALGLLLARTGKPAEARAELTTATTIETPDPALKARAYRALARLDQVNDPAAASADLLEALKLSPENPEDALLAGQLAEAAHDLPTAEAAYRRILAKQPDNTLVVTALAHLLRTTQRPSEAETLLTKALARHPGDPTLTSQLAAAYASEDKLPEAIALVEALHTTSPADENLTRLLAHLYSEDKQPGKAEPLYVALLSQSPHDASLLSDRGEALIALHRFPEAEASLKLSLAARDDPHAFARPSDMATTAGNLALAASHNGNPELVLQALQIRATVLPQSPLSLFLAATAHDTLHHWKLASEFYKQFLTAAAGKFPDQEWEASHRLIALEHRK